VRGSHVVAASGSWSSVFSFLHLTFPPLFFRENLKFRKKTEDPAFPFAMLISSWVHSHFAFLKGECQCPSPDFLERWALHNRSTLLDSQMQMCSLWLTFSDNIHESVELWAKPYGIKVRCYWERLGGNILRTHREHKKKKFPLPSFPKRKQTGPLMSPYWAFHWLYGTFIFQNCLSPFLAWANGMATPLKEGKKTFLPTPFPKRKRLDPH
jgi:hypothetical protein